jgi:hypothetical protein
MYDKRIDCSDGERVTPFNLFKVFLAVPNPAVVIEHGPKVSWFQVKGRLQITFQRDETRAFRVLQRTFQGSFIELLTSIKGNYVKTCWVLHSGMITSMDQMNCSL